MAKVLDPDDIPVEIWKSLGEEGIDVLFMKKILGEDTIHERWRDSTMEPARFTKRREMSKVVKIVDK